MLLCGSVACQLRGIWQCLRPLLKTDQRCCWTPYSAHQQAPGLKIPGAGEESLLKFHRTQPTQSQVAAMWGWLAFKQPNNRATEEDWGSTCSPPRKHWKTIVEGSHLGSHTLFFFSAFFSLYKFSGLYMLYKFFTVEYLRDHLVWWLLTKCTTKSIACSFPNSLAPTPCYISLREEAGGEL